MKSYESKKENRVWCFLESSLIFIVEKEKKKNYAQVNHTSRCQISIFTHHLRKNTVRVLIHVTNSLMVRWFGSGYAMARIFFHFSLAFHSDVSTLNKWAHQSIRIIIRTAVFYLVERCNRIAANDSLLFLFFWLYS